MEKKRKHNARPISPGCMPDPILAIKYVREKNMSGVKACNKCSEPHIDDKKERKKYGAEYGAPHIKR